jgi:hypothetical protein
MGHPPWKSCPRQSPTPTADGEAGLPDRYHGASRDRRLIGDGHELGATSVSTVTVVTGLLITVDAGRRRPRCSPRSPPRSGAWLAVDVTVMSRHDPDGAATIGGT